MQTATQFECPQNENGAVTKSMEMEELFIVRYCNKLLTTYRIIKYM